MSNKHNTEVRFRGLPISGGVALARTCLFRQGHHDPPPDYRVTGKGIAREHDRLKRAMSAVADHVERLRKAVAERIGPAEAEIFTVQRAILEDPALDRKIVEAIDDGFNAETAVVRTFQEYEAKLLAVEDDYIRERASDLGEIKRRLVDALRGAGSAFECANEPKCQRGQQRIIVAQELTPSATLALSTDEILGIVTARGGATSHAAILARALGIPAVSGIDHIHDLVACGTEVLVNGDTGDVIAWPGKELLKLLNGSPAEYAAPLGSEPVEDLCVMANIGVAADVKEARGAKAEGIGLYRTELSSLRPDGLSTRRSNSRGTPPWPRRWATGRSTSGCSTSAPTSRRRSSRSRARRTRRWAFAAPGSSCIGRTICARRRGRWRGCRRFGRST